MASDPPRRPRRSRDAPHEQRVFRLALLTGLPAVVVCIALLIEDGHSPKVQWTLGLLVVGAWLGTALALRERVVRPLHTISNMLAALREGDFSIRARNSGVDDALALALLEANLLGETLRSQRLGALEASALLRTVMQEIDVAVVAFDDEARVRLVNRAGERLLGQPSERLLGRSAGQLGLQWTLEADVPRTSDVTFPGGSGRWEVRRQAFRQAGRPHTLVVLADLSRTLREEELQAWQRLVRVLSHEINNSLAPIKSIAGSLSQLLAVAPRPADADDDLRRGLEVMGGRAAALERFMSSYARLARLPAPQRAPLDVGTWVRRVTALETRLSVEVSEGPTTNILADGDQLDQLLINLVRNAVDASLETGGGVRLSWARRENVVEVIVEDDGRGLSSTANLFVPFFTTKPAGSGIGLVLSRQVADAHAGALTLENRQGTSGCVARLLLPLA